MNGLNSIILEGNVIDTNVSKMPNGTSVAEMTIAVKRTYKNANGEFAEEVSFFEIKAYGNVADICEKYATKDRGIRIVGRLKQERYEADGKLHSKVVVLAEHVEFKPEIKA